jgi:hypothetical protein
MKQSSSKLVGTAVRTRTPERQPESHPKMSPEETRKLLRYIAAIDGRKVTNDGVTAWHQLLGGYTYADTKTATETAIKNASGKYLEVGMIFDVLRGQPSRAHSRWCDHGVPLGDYCHDCTHPPGCPTCRPVRGISDTPENRLATVRASASRMGARPDRLPTIHEGEPEW